MPTVLITGASGGLGVELARLFAADGHDLVLAARSTDKLTALAEELAGRHPIRARPVTVDLSAAAGPGVLTQALARDGLEVDVLVNNAGVGLHGRFAATSLDRELAMLQLNVTSLVHLTKLLLPGMRARGHGQIVNVASTAAFQPGPLMSVYYASKAFVLSFSPSRQDEMAILRYHLSFAKEDILSIAVGFLQDAHQLNLEYSIRAGLHLIQYAVKRLAQDSSHPVALDRMWQEALLKVLGAESLDLEEQSKRRKRAMGDQALPKGFGDFFFEEDGPLHPGR